MKIEWSDTRRFQIGDTQFYTYALERPDEPGDDALLIGKSAESVEELALVLQEFRGGNVVELGVFRGGSAAFIALIAEPRKLVTIDNQPEPARSLELFVDRHGLHDTITRCWGTDQGDQERLRAIVDEAFGDEEIDLVVDDASHKLAETRASFDVLFPRLRPGGLYLIEDWRWDIALHERLSRSLRDPESDTYEATRSAVASALADPSSDVSLSITAMAIRASEDATDPWHDEAVALLSERSAEHGDAASRGDDEARGWRPLARLIVELVFAQASTDDVVGEVTIRPDAVAVRRGPAPVDVTSFRLTDQSADHFTIL
jgi:predicted O-methyltransferase YrrM